MENFDNQNTENQTSINLNKNEDQFQSRIDMIELRASLDKVRSEPERKMPEHKAPLLL